MSDQGDRIEKDVQDMQDEGKEFLPHSALTRTILGCCFAVMRELGSGFLERVYKNALFLSMRQEGLSVEVEKLYEVKFRGKVVGRYNADLVVDNTVIVELKCCEHLLPEHQAQVINYLTAAQLPVGLLVNFRYRKLDYKRMFCEEKVPFEENAKSAIPKFL